MDNVTHAALGFAIAEAAFPSLGRSGLALAVVASELPDIDIFFGLGNPWSMVTTHRAITHSIFVAPLAAAALAGLWTWFSSAGGFRAFFVLALVCLVGHIFLDVLTTYGTQILEPFSQRRFGWGWVAVIDPVVTVSLLVGGLAAWWIARATPPRRTGRRWRGCWWRLATSAWAPGSMPGRWGCWRGRRRRWASRSPPMPRRSSARSSCGGCYTKMIIRSGWPGTTR